MGKGLIGGLSDLLGLDAILDPGADDRRRGLNQEQAATDLWLGELGREPSSRDLYNAESYQSPGISQFERLPRDAEWAGGQAAQLQALRQMQGIASGGGYTQLERDQIRQSQQQAAQYEQSQRGAQLQQLESRGMGGSGAEIAMRAQAQQSGANRSQNAATDIATAAQMRALQAMQGSAAQGQNMSTQATQRASAVDQFNNANTTRMQGVLQRNSDRQTAATQGAWQNRQNTLAGATGQYNANSANATDEANRQAGVVSGLIGGLIS